MNILMVSPFDLVVKRLWGPTIRLHSLAKELINMGHKVIMAGPPPFYGERPPLLEGVSLYYFKRPFYKYCYQMDGKERERAKANTKINLIKAIYSRSWEILNLTRRHNIDILYLNRAFFETGYPVLFSHYIRRIPFIYDWDDIEGLHGFSTSNRLPLKIQLIETINEVVFARLANAVVVASDYIREFALKIGVKEDRLFYAPTVANSHLFNPSVNGDTIRERLRLKNKKVLLYCGNLMKGSGVRLENLIITISILTRKDPGFHLVIVGEGDQKGELEKLSIELDVRDNITFVGEVPYTEVPQYIKAADLCLALFPVNVITLAKSPLKIYEYMSCAKPLIARDVGEISRCIRDGINGLLVYSDNPQEYADKILSAFSNQDKLRQMGEMARATIEESFLWERSAQVIKKACEAVLNNNVGR